MRLLKTLYATIVGVYIIFFGQTAFALDSGYNCVNENGERRQCATQTQCAQALNCQPPGCVMTCDFFDNTSNTGFQVQDCLTPSGEKKSCSSSAQCEEVQRIFPGTKCAPRSTATQTDAEGNTNGNNSSPFANIFAGGGFIPTACTGESNTIQTCGINELITVAINVSRLILGLLGSVALVMFIYGGVMFLVSAGSSEQVKNGKTIILNAVIGIIIVLFAWIAVNTIVAALTGTDIASPTIFSGQAPLTLPK